MLVMRGGVPHCARGAGWFRKVVLYPPMSMVIVQVLGLCISASLFFIGYADRRWVRNLSFAMCLMTGIQSFLLGQSGVLVMNLVNLTYYSMLMLEDRLKFV